MQSWLGIDSEYAMYLLRSRALGYKAEAANQGLAFPHNVFSRVKILLSSFPARCASFKAALTIIG